MLVRPPSPAIPRSYKTLYARHAGQGAPPRRGAGAFCLGHEGGPSKVFVLWFGLKTDAAKVLHEQPENTQPEHGIPEAQIKSTIAFSALY